VKLSNMRSKRAGTSDASPRDLIEISYKIQ
jgi:hypothetical protein